MRRIKPKVICDKRYCIKEVCSLLCICRDTLRKYTQLGQVNSICISSREIYYLGTEVNKLYSIITKNQIEDI